MKIFEADTDIMGDPNKSTVGKCVEFPFLEDKERVIPINDVSSLN